jgi:hypothetical protein
MNENKTQTPIKVIIYLIIINIFFEIYLNLRLILMIEI